MDGVTTWIVGGALAISFAVLDTVCAAAFAAAPGVTLDFFDAWFHGLNLAGLQAGAKPFTFGVFLYGLVGVTVTAFVTGAVFGACHNLLRRRGAT